MTPNNDVNNLQTASFIDGPDNSDRAAERDSVTGAFEPQFLTNWPTLRMTATWGS